MLWLFDLKHIVLQIGYISAPINRYLVLKNICFLSQYS